MHSVYDPLRRLAAVLASDFCHQFYKIVQIVGACIEFAFDIFQSGVCRSESLEITIIEAILEQQVLIYQTLVVQVGYIRQFISPVHLGIWALGRHAGFNCKCSV